MYSTNGKSCEKSCFDIWHETKDIENERICRTNQLGLVKTKANEAKAKKKACRNSCVESLVSKLGQLACGDENLHNLIQEALPVQVHGEGSIGCIP